MKTISFQIPEELHTAYKEACALTGTKMCHPIIVKIKEVAYGDKKVAKRR